jgi:hypothetical protein
VEFDNTAVFNSPSIIPVTDPVTTAYTLVDTGYYYVEFTGTTAALSLLGGFAIELNGSPVATTGTLVSVGTTVTLNAVIHVTSASSILQVVGTGLTVTLATGSNVSIIVEQLSTP